MYLSTRKREERWGTCPKCGGGLRRRNHPEIFQCRKCGVYFCGRCWKAEFMSYAEALEHLKDCTG